MLPWGHRGETTRTVWLSDLLITGRSVYASAVLFTSTVGGGQPAGLTIGEE